MSRCLLIIHLTPWDCWLCCWWLELLVKMQISTNLMERLRLKITKHKSYSFCCPLHLFVCVCDSGSSPGRGKDHWRAGVWASLSSIHGFPQLWLPLLWWGAHQQAVGALCCPLLVQVSMPWWRKYCFQIVHALSCLVAKFYFVLPLVLLDLFIKVNTKHICRWKTNAFQSRTICGGHLLNLKII